MATFDTTDVFLANMKAKETIVINQGGTSSSKTYSIDQLLVFKAIQEPGAEITVTGESIPNLKKGAYRDMQNFLNRSPSVMAHVEGWNKTDRVITFKNGSFIEFISNLDEQSAKNGKRDYLFVNEAQGIDYTVFFQLAIRTRKQVFVDYNPTAPFWVHDKLIGTGPGQNDLSATVKLIISDHRHNTFLTQQEHDKIEGIKDPQLWRVYARGLTGNITGLIYPHWQRIRDEDYPWDAPFFGGLDFGYTNDPTAGVKIVRLGDNIYLHELFYRTGMAPVQQKQVFTAYGFTNQIPIYSEHDDDQIPQLRRHGLLVIPAKKGPNSLNAGIQFLNQFKVFYTASSANIDFEKKRYKWLTDPATGKPTNTPIDQFNHLLDSARYGIYTQYFRKYDAA